jgi:PAS domain S-box-containing protein
MEIIYIVLVAVGMLSGLLIGYIKWVFLEKNLLKSEIYDLQRRLDASSVQCDELPATQNALQHLKEKCIKLENVISALLAASANGILTVDSQMRIRHFNKHYCEIWGLTEEEVHVGAKVYDVLKLCMEKTLDPEMFFLNHQKINYSHDMIWNAETRLLGGKIFQSSSSPIRGLNGTYYGRIWEFFDVTERVQREQNLYDAYSTIETQYKNLESAEEALRHQVSLQKETEHALKTENSFLSALLETATHGIASIDSHLCVHHYNKRFCEMWGLTEDIIYPGADWHEIINHCMKQTINSDQFLSNAQMAIDSWDMTLDSQIYLLNGKVFKSFSAPVHGLDETYQGRIWKIGDITDDYLLKQQKLERTDTIHNID